MMNATIKALLLKHVVCGCRVVGIHLMKTRDTQVTKIDILSLKEQALAISFAGAKGNRTSVYCPIYEHQGNMSACDRSLFISMRALLQTSTQS